MRNKNNSMDIMNSFEHILCKINDFCSQNEKQRKKYILICKSSHNKNNKVVFALMNSDIRNRALKQVKSHS